MTTPTPPTEQQVKEAIEDCRHNVGHAKHGGVVFFSPTKVSVLLSHITTLEQRVKELDDEIAVSREWHSRLMPDKHRRYFPHITECPNCPKTDTKQKVYGIIGMRGLACSKCGFVWNQPIPIKDT